MNRLPIGDFLGCLKGKRVFFDPLHGNHGDRLIFIAAQSLLEGAPFALAKTPQSANFILLNGGGSMADGWFGLERLARYSHEFPSHPLAVMPSSYFLDHSELIDLSRDRQAPMWLWAREQVSLEILRGAGFDDRVIPGLDHDLAFSLDQHPLVRKLRLAPVQDRVLIVERDDWEGPTGRRRPFAPHGLEFIPEKLRAATRRILLRPIRKKQDRESLLCADALRFVHQEHPETTRMIPLVADISLAETGSFEDYLQSIARAAVIVTTRLHVAILGHLLGRTTYLVEGSYHKNRAVFEYSMLQGSTRLLSWTGQRLELSTYGCVTG